MPTIGEKMIEGIRSTLHTLHCHQRAFEYILSIVLIVVTKAEPMANRDSLGTMIHLHLRYSFVVMTKKSSDATRCLSRISVGMGIVFAHDGRVPDDDQREDTKLR